MEMECLRILAWLEKSGYMPESAAYNVECAKANIETSIRYFLKAAHELEDSDFTQPRVFGERLANMENRTLSLRGDLQDIEEALRKALIALPEGIFDDE